MQNSDDTRVKIANSLKYLGCLLDENGQLTGELKRRIAMARDDFNQLAKVWNHASVAVKTKSAVYQQCILSKLLYGLESAWLTKHDKKLLDSFHIRCLRKIYGISHSMISRVSNQFILHLYGTIPLSSLLLRRQLNLYGKIARLLSTALIRKLVLQENEYTALKITDRKQGRPRLQWASELEKIVENMLPEAANRERYFLNKELWTSKVWQFTELYHTDT